jgi:hypothetical protein
MIGKTRSDRLILFVEDPPELESVTVLASNVAVLLPSDKSAGTYERLASVDPWPPKVRKLSGKSSSWPTRPVYWRDRWEIERLAARSTG